MKPIQVSGIVTAKTIERLLRTHSRNTSKVSKVTFDLTEIDSIDLLSAMRLYYWVAQIRARSDTPVQVKLPMLDELLNRTARLLLDSRMLESLKALGAEVDHIAPSSEVALPFESLLGGPSVSLLNRIGSQIRRTTDELPEEAIREFSHGVFFELLENAATHGRSQTAYFAGNIVAVSADDQDAFLPSFRAAEHYIELAVGDLGPGIEETLGPHMPAHYRPPFVYHRPFTLAERQVLYAFEYTSTSSPAERVKRLTNYYSDHSLEVWRVATGLCCVLNIVRSRHGQVVVRTPNALVALDFWRGTTALVKTSDSLSIADLGPLNGTHFLLRFPSRRVSLPTGYTMPLPEAAIAASLEVIAPFPESDASEPERVHSGTLALQQHVESRRERTGVSLIRAGRIPLTTRAGALFTAELAGMDRGERHIICLDDIAAGARPARRPGSHDYVPPPAHGAGVILGGNLFRNSFWSVDYANAEVPAYLAERNEDEYRFNTLLLSRARAVFAQSVKTQLSTILKSPSVRLTDGPFLIEGQYFTNTFFSVAGAIRDAATLQLFADWAACIIPRDCDALIFVTAPVAALTHQVAKRMHEMYGMEPAVFGESQVIHAEHGLAADRKCVAITDVICRGEVLDSILSAVYPAAVRMVLTLVDARPSDADAGFFEFDMANAERKARLTTVLRESIPTFDSETAAVRSREQVDASGQRLLAITHPKIIDPDTHRPTVYIVDEPVAVSDVEIILNAARESKALRYGHALHDGRHYAVYLHFPRLFNALRPRIETWLRGEFGRRDSPLPRRCIVLNEEDSLQWVAGSIANIDPTIAIEEVSAGDLRAPEPPSKVSTRGTTVLIMPGSASGDFAQRALEYASRSRPESIVLLIVITRMEPAHLSFLRGLSVYRDIHVRVSSFAQLTVRAYPDRLACPLCDEREARERLVKNTVDKFPALHAALVRSARSIDAVDIPHTASDDVLDPSEGELSSVRIRALYEASEHDLTARRTLTERLTCDVDEIDTFLEVVAMEYRSSHLSRHSIHRRLLTAYTAIRNRVDDLLLTATPPFSIASKMPALAHISPSACVLAAARLINAYASSQADLEAICVTLVAMRREPETSELQIQHASGDAKRLVIEMQKFIATPPQPDDSAAFVESIERVWSVLIRSSLVTVRLPELSELALRKRPANGDIQRIALHVYDGWNSELLNLLSEMVLNPHWPFLAARHTQLAADIAALTDVMHRVRCLAEQPAGVDIVALAEAAERIPERLAIAIKDFFIAPVHSEINNMPESLSAGDITIRIRKTVAPDIPPIFADLRSLNEALREVRRNWIEHASGESPEVRIDVRRDDEFVILDLADTFGGSINRDSWGGVRLMRKFCEAYGGYLHIDENRSDGTKAVIFGLRVLHEEVRRNNR